LSQDALLSWGWRIPFLSAAVIGLVGLYVRLKLEESPAYQQQEQAPEHKGMAQFRRTVIDQWRPLLVVIGLVMGINVVTYTLTAYLPTYLKSTAGVGDTRALLIILIVLVILVLAVTQVARLSDRIGRRPIMFFGCGLVLVTSIPAFLLLRTGSNLMIFAGALLIGLMLLCPNTTEPATLPALFPTEVRGGAVSVGYNLSVSAFGGTTADRAGPRHGRRQHPGACLLPDARRRSGRGGGAVHARDGRRAATGHTTRRSEQGGGQGHGQRCAQGPGRRPAVRPGMIRRRAVPSLGKGFQPLS
jgi:MFS family permease